MEKWLNGKLKCQMVNGERVNKMVNGEWRNGKWKCQIVNGEMIK